ncbi:M4 family metallopeptidase [Butyrivibrio sp. FCS014]|uniref:M4 family metallopeptidase n=1 Tax=Butyrivibrio sp. FCS014 TaxID=1408304 RepID=UPI000466DB77|nr:M4 family metallopeptidase [Butyrivibrio sp. FCS014]
MSKRKSVLAVCLSVLMLSSIFAGCGEKEYDSYSLGENKASDSVFGTETTTGSESSGSGSVFGDSTASADEEDEYADHEEEDSIFGTSDEDDGSFVVNDGPVEGKQLTEADIQAMNNNKAIIVRSNNGYVSTLVGRYYNKKIKVVPGEMVTAEDAIESLNGIADLLGLQEGTEFFCSDMGQDGAKYTYIAYQQRDGQSTIFNATLHIVIDPEGYPCAVSSSFTTALGESIQGTPLSKEEVLAKVIEMDEPGAHYYPEATAEAKIWVAATETIENCYVFFKDNPLIDESFEAMRYIAVYFSKDGKNLFWYLPTATLGVEADTSYYNNDDYFKGMQATTWSGSVNFLNGGNLDVTINVAYNPNDGMYYMMDLERKIAVADCYDFLYKGATLTFLKSKDNTWDERDIAAMYNYECAYDAYKAIGIKSPDGFSTPILLLRKYCNQNQEGIENACYMAKYFGWFTFCYCEVLDISYDLDVVGHEYTHAVTESCILGNNYMNDAGAINESYSDVMGNIIEYMYNRTSDKQWLSAEMSGETNRNMSNPIEYHQPDRIGGAYYIRNVEVPNQNFNDTGGVHINSGIPNLAAVLIYQAGMSLDTMFDLYYTSMQVLTPANSYEDIYAALIYSARANGYDQYEDIITKAFTQVGVLSDKTRQQLEEEIPQGCGKAEIKVVNYGYENVLFRLLVYDTGGKFLGFSFPDKNGIISIALPEGNYLFNIQAINTQSNQSGDYVFGSSGWEYNNGRNAAVVTITNGKLLTLPDA